MNIKTVGEPLAYFGAALLTAAAFVGIGRFAPPAELSLRDGSLVPTVVEPAVDERVFQAIAVDVVHVPIAVIESFFNDKKRRGALADQTCANFGQGGAVQHSMQANTLEIKCGRVLITVTATPSTASPTETSSISITMEEPAAQPFTVPAEIQRSIVDPIYVAQERHRIDSYPPYRCPKWKGEAESDLADLREIEVSEDHPRFLAILNCIETTEREPSCHRGEGLLVNSKIATDLIDKETKKMKAEHKSEEEIEAQIRRLRARIAEQ